MVAPDADADATLDPATPLEAQVTLNPVFTSFNKNTAGRRLQEEDPFDVKYKWLIVVNNVGNYDGTLSFPGNECNSTLPGYPDTCDWPSIHDIKATAPIYASGDNSNNIAALTIDTAGDYMVTVMAEGYRLCGGYFTVPADSSPDVTTLDVSMVCLKHPLPLGTIRLFVFHDNRPCNGQYDPLEAPIGDFGIGINDIEGPITEDYYGNSLLYLVSDPITGMLEVPNMWPGRYDIDVGPPPFEGWVKTNTLEGGPGWDYWLYGKYHQRSKTCWLLTTTMSILTLAI